LSSRVYGYVNEQARAVPHAAVFRKKPAQTAQLLT
jgi:hypothetical protein